MKVRTSKFVKDFAVHCRGCSVESLREEFAGACIDFAGELCERVPGARLAYFDNLKHPAWKYHAAMVFDGWVHDLWYPLLPLRLFMLTIGASQVEYPSEQEHED